MINNIIYKLKTNKIKIIIFIVSTLLLVLPFLITYNYYNANGYDFVMESSIFGFDYKIFINDFLYNKSIFANGVNSIITISHFFLFSIFYFLNTFFNQISSYFIFIILLITISFYFTIKMFTNFIILIKKNNVISNTSFLISSLLAILFISSISNFLFLSSTSAFFISSLILLIQLYCLSSFVVKENNLYLFFLIFLNFLNTFNITNLLINIFFINIFYLILYYLKYKYKNLKIIKYILILNIGFIPFLILFYLQIYINAYYISDSISSSTNILAENFYSSRASFINTFTQTNFWALFGGFNGKLYYEFSNFYNNKIIYIFSFIPYILFLFLSLFKKITNIKERYLNILFLILFLFIFQFMIGLNNPLYNFLYNHITIFQIFRNITKFAPVLLLTITILIFINTVNSKHKILIIILLLLSGLYNIPYWTNMNNIYSQRIIKQIPENYLAASTFLNSRLSNSDNILVLPAIYSNDYYKFSNKNELHGQGLLFNFLLNSRSYVLAQIGSGDVAFQNDIDKLFITSDNSRNLDIDYNKLDSFIKKYNLNYLIVSKDSVSEYQKYSDIYNWIDKNNFKKIKTFDSIDIYQKEEYFRPYIISDNIDFKTKNAKNININLKNIKKNTNLSLLNNFNSNWFIYLEKFNNYECQNKIQFYFENKNINECYYKKNVFENGELSYLYKKPVFQDSHKLVYDYANQWTIDPEYIKKNFDKSYYKENPDGSIDLELTLYFKPQSYFYLGLIISGTTLAGCITYLIIDSIRNKKKKDDVIELQTNSEDIKK